MSYEPSHFYPSNSILFRYAQELIKIKNMENAERERSSRSNLVKDTGLVGIVITR